MDYLFRLLGLGDLEQIRLAQIQRQKLLDQKVTTHVTQCSQTIAQYYLFQREFARQQQTEFIQASLTDKVTVLGQQLQANNQAYNDLDQALNSGKFCQKLNNLTDSQET